MANEYTFDQLMQGFGVVTVMNATVYRLKDGASYVGGGGCHHTGKTGRALTPDDFECTGLYLDTLKIANFNQEGPTKTITGGQYANPLIKYGKTMTAEMQDALGRGPVMQEFFGCEYDPNGRISVTDIFPGAICIEGETFFIEQKTGEKRPVHILIPQFLPDGIFNLVQDAEGDATVFDLNGTVSVTEIADAEGANPRSVFYEIRKESWFSADTDMVDSNDYHIEETKYINAAKAYAEERIALVNDAAAIVGDKNPKTAAIKTAGTIETNTEDALKASKIAVDAATATALEDLTKPTA